LEEASSEEPAILERSEECELGLGSLGGVNSP